MPEENNNNTPRYIELIEKQNQRLAERDKAQDKVNAEQAAIAEESVQQEEVQTALLKQVFGVLGQMFGFQKMVERNKSREIKRTEKDGVEERQPVKVDTIKADGFEGLFGAIIGAVVGFVVGFVAEVTKAYRAFLAGFKEIPALVRKLIRGVKASFNFIREAFAIIGEETGITKAFTRLMNSIKGLAAEGTLLGDIIQLVKAEAKVVGGAFRNIFFGVIEFGKTVINAILKPFRAIGNFIRELKIAEQFAVEAELLSSAFTKIINIPKTLATKITSVVAKVEQLLAPAIELLESAFNIAKNLVSRFTATVGRISEGIRAIGTGAEAAAESVSVVSRVSASVSASFAEFRVLMVNAFEGVKAIVGGLGKVKGPLGLVFDAVKGFAEGFASLFSAMKPIGELVGKLFIPAIVIYEAVKNIYDQFFGAANESKSFGEKFLDTIKGFLKDVIEELITVPIDLVKDIISWIGGKLGFKGFEEALDSFSFTEWFGKLFDDFFEALDDFGKFLGGAIFDLVNDPVKMAKDIIGAISEGIGNLISGLGKLIKGAIVKVLNLIPGVNIETEESDEDKLKRETKERKKEAESSGIVKNPTVGYATVDEEKLKDLSNEQLQQMSEDWASYKKVSASIQKEIDRRLEAPAPESFADSEFPTAKEPQAPEKVNEATMAEVLQPEPITPTVIVEAPETPAPEISGAEQQSVDMFEDLYRSQEQLFNTQQQAASGQNGGNTNITSNAVSTSNVVNNSYTSMPQPSSRDNSDQLYIFRATGSSR